jgi:GNAT superfamily N-acetyltransferase
MITDYTTFAYLADVYVEAEHRGQGLSKRMMEIILQQPWVQSLRRIMLATLDAHDLYGQFGFVKPAFPERFMEINRPAIYGDPQNVCS